MDELMKQENELINYSPQGLISQALAQNVPIETLERLMDLAERWDAKQAKSAFLQAMNIFQSKVPELIKSKKVDFPAKSGGTVKYNYMPLAKITKAIQPILQECGLSFRWEFEDENEKIKCRCIGIQGLGYSESNSMSAGKDTTGNKNDIQSIGSTRQYLQRYTLIGALGLSTADTDDDGQSAKSKSKEEIPEPQERVEWGKLIKNCENIKDLMSVWKRMSKKEQTEFKDDFSKIKSNIETELKKQSKQ